MDGYDGPDAQSEVVMGAFRGFLALEIPADVRRQLAEAIGALRAELPRASWVRPDALHLTVKFLGQVTPETAEQLVHRLRPTLAGLPPVEVGLAGAGAFPQRGRPRVAWVGGSASGAWELARAVEREAAALGFPAEGRPFALHLTLARLRQPWPPEAVARFLAWGGGWSAAPFVGRELVLFSSRLEPTGAVYTPLERIHLGGGA